MWKFTRIPSQAWFLDGNTKLWIYIINRQILNENTSPFCKSQVSAVEIPFTGSSEDKIISPKRYWIDKLGTFLPIHFQAPEMLKKA